MAEMITKLYDASIQGNISALHDIINIDPLILDRQIIGCYTETPLHISAMRGHVDFTAEILKRQPEMASERSLPQNSTPLHLASAKGYLEIVTLLLIANPDTCHAIDNSGRNPSHIAAVKGRTDVLKELVRARPLSLRAVVEGDTILHLCVKYNKVDALKVVVEVENMEDAFVICKNGYGNTILHLAVADKQIEMIKYIIALNKVDVNAKNDNGFTALDILSQSRRDVNDILISESLQLVGGRRARGLSSPSPIICEIEPNQTGAASSLDGTQRRKPYDNDQFGNSMMVVASLIISMSFQAAINPPGGVWQDNTQGKVGTSIMAATDPTEYQKIETTNTISFVASILVIVSIFFMPMRVLANVLPRMLMVLALLVSYITYIISWSFLKGPVEQKNLPAGFIALIIGSLVTFSVLGHFIRVRVLRGWDQRANSNHASQRAIQEIA